MQKIIFLLLISISTNVLFSQRIFPPGSHMIYSGVQDAKRMQKPPIFPYGIDSLQRFYFSHFAGFDSILTKAINHGDTAKYIRVYFSFVVDRDGAVTGAHFI